MNGNITIPCTRITFLALHLREISGKGKHTPSFIEFHKFLVTVSILFWGPHVWTHKQTHVHTCRNLESGRENPELLVCNNSHQVSQLASPSWTLEPSDQERQTDWI